MAVTDYLEFAVYRKGYSVPAGPQVPLSKKPPMEHTKFTPSNL